MRRDVGALAPADEIGTRAVRPACRAPRHAGDCDTTGTSPDRSIDVEGAMPSQPIPWSARAAGVFWILEAIGFGGSMPIALAHLARRGELPMTPWGFRAFAGPFERLGRRRFALLGAALMGVSALEAVAGVWLAQGRRRGALLGLALTPPATVLGVGFALPFWLAPIPVRSVILLRTWRRLR
jgi:hypothetical protein